MNKRFYIFNVKIKQDLGLRREVDDLTGLKNQMIKKQKFKIKMCSSVLSNIDRIIELVDDCNPR